MSNSIDMLSRLGAWLKRLATHDTFPDFSAKVRRFVYHPFGILVLTAVVSLMCGLFIHPQGFVLCAGVLAVMALGIIWPWLSLRGLSGALAFDRSRGSEGEPVEVWLTICNRLPWAAWGLAVRDGFSADEAAPAVAGIATAPRWRTALCRWWFTPERRGIYPLTQPRLTTGFPFGLWENGRHLAVERTVIVWPRTLPVGPIPPVSGDHQVEGNVSRAKVGTSGDVLGVRPYRRGDSPRRIHWGQSARHDRLIVCELQANSRPVIQLVLDADASIHAGHGPDASLEWAIRIVASFAKGWLADGAQVGLAWGNHEIPPASGQAQLHKILDTLASIPADCAKRLDDVLACPKCRGFREGLQIIVTTDRYKGRGVKGEAEDQHFVVLKADAFEHDMEQPRLPLAPRPSPLAPHSHAPHPSPLVWLWIDSAEAIPSLLHRGWREARHGS